MLAGCQTLLGTGAAGENNISKYKTKSTIGFNLYDKQMFAEQTLEKSQELTRDDFKLPDCL